MTTFTLDHPQYPDQIASLLWGKSHYFDADTRRFFRSRLCEAALLVQKGRQQSDFTLLVTRETMGAGFTRDCGREHKVCTFNRKGHCQEHYKGPSRRQAQKVYREWSKRLSDKAYGKL